LIKRFEFFVKVELKMRLTAEVIEKSASFANALGERELDLRGM
jgi:hypothetical protein